MEFPEHFTSKEFPVYQHVAFSMTGKADFSWGSRVEFTICKFLHGKMLKWSQLKNSQSLEVNIAFRNHKYPKSTFLWNYRLFSAKYLFMVKHKMFFPLSLPLQLKLLSALEFIELLKRLWLMQNDFCTKHSCCEIFSLPFWNQRNIFLSRNYLKSCQRLARNSCTETFLIFIDDAEGSLFFY